MSSALTAPELDREDELAAEPVLAKGFEFVDGQLKELNVSAKSARVSGRLVTRLTEHCESQQPGWIFPGETPFQCFKDDPKRIRKPDTAFIALDRYTAEQCETEGYITVRPDLVAEVISPNDLAYDVTDKRREWLAVGVKLLWIIEPVDKTIHIYKPDGSVSLLHENDMLSGESVLPGFSIPVADLFRLPQPVTT
jgi:Uma2 family endonuclease